MYGGNKGQTLECVSERMYAQLLSGRVSQLGVIMLPPSTPPPPPPPGTFGSVWRRFGGDWHQRVEARDAARRPAGHKVDPTPHPQRKNDPVQNGISATLL